MGRTGTGTLTADASTVSVSSSVTYALIQIGDDQEATGSAAGELTATNGSTISVNSTASFTGVSVGDGRGTLGTNTTGELNLVGSSLQIGTTGTASTASLEVGRRGGDGTVSFNNSTATISSNGDIADDNGAGLTTTGAVTFSNNSNVALNSNAGAPILVGDAVATTGTLNVTSGSDVTVTETGLATSAVVQIGTANGAATTSVANVTGLGSSVTGLDTITVGFNPNLGVGTGNGLLSITDQATVGTQSALIGNGGALQMGTNGTLQLGSGNLVINNGNLDLLSGVGGAHVINGDVEFHGNSQLNIQIANDGSSSGSLTVTNGTANEIGSLTTVIQSTYQFATGDTYRLPTTSTPYNINGAVNVLGQAAGFDLGAAWRQRDDRRLHRHQQRQWYRCQADRLLSVFLSRRELAL